MSITIGKKVEEILSERGMSKAELGRRLNKERQTVDDIIQRKSIDSELLTNLSRILNFNFLSYLGDIIENSSDRLMRIQPKMITEEETNVWKVKYYDTLEKYTSLLETTKSAITDFSKLSLSEPQLMK